MSFPILTILLAAAAVLVVGAVLFVLGMRTKSPLVLAPLVAVSKRLMNPRQMRTAGRPGAYAGIVRHRGRVSGRAYETPVGIIEVADGFLIALPYGTRTQWLRNVQAAGGAEIVVEGETHRVDRPELVPTARYATSFSPTDQRLFRWLAVNKCLRLRPVANEDQPSGASSSPGSANARPPREEPAAAIASR
jgi:deazaflavin-dependent oxidoreductase (nitroreductase family)